MRQAGKAAGDGQVKATAAVLIVSAVAVPALAHHSNDYHFDRNVGVTVSGTVKAFRFINPHSRLLVDVAGEDGSVVTWDCEMGVPTS